MEEANQELCQRIIYCILRCYKAHTQSQWVEHDLILSRKPGSTKDTKRHKDEELGAFWSSWCPFVFFVDPFLTF